MDDVQDHLKQHEGQPQDRKEDITKKAKTYPVLVSVERGMSVHSWYCWVISDKISTKILFPKSGFKIKPIERTTMITNTLFVKNANKLSIRDLLPYIGICVYILNCYLKHFE